MNLDTSRHQRVFSSTQFGERRVDIIGCGATGSRVALDIAKKGVQNIHIWDHDTVAGHNIANQAYGLEHVGLMKVEALASIIKRATGTDVTPHDERVVDQSPFGTIVFLLTDTMASRREIWDNSLRFNLVTRLVIETRMGADSGRIYSVDPNRMSDVRAWEGTLCTDEEATDSLCGARVSVSSTADIIAGFAVWQMMRWFALEMGKIEDSEFDNEIVFGTQPPMLVARRF